MKHPSADGIYVPERGLCCTTTKAGNTESLRKEHSNKNVLVSQREVEWGCQELKPMCSRSSLIPSQGKKKKKNSLGSGGQGQEGPALVDCFLSVNHFADKWLNPPCVPESYVLSSYYKWGDQGRFVFCDPANKMQTQNQVKNRLHGLCSFLIDVLLSQEVSVLKHRW